MKIDQFGDETNFNQPVAIIFTDRFSVSSRTFGFELLKTLIDTFFILFGLPLLLLASLILLSMNPFFNPGELFYTEDRMGKNGKRFKIWKFRTMRAVNSVVEVRSFLEPLEEERIGRFGKLLRKIRIDELPNLINIIQGQMTLIGPRPDTWAHAEKFLTVMPNYQNRLQVLPGITGLAQIRGGYADTKRSIERKIRYDTFYVDNPSGRLELFVIARTILVLFSGFGAK